MSKEWEEREFERQIDKIEDEFPPYRTGRYLDYRELSTEEILELKNMEKATVGGKYFDEDLV